MFQTNKYVEKQLSILFTLSFTFARKIVGQTSIHKHFIWDLLDSVLYSYI